MGLPFLLDENLPGRFLRAVERHNKKGVDVLDAVRVGAPPDLPFGINDPAILRWCEAHSRILVTEDKNTMPVHFADHLAAGNHSPGVFLVRPSAGVPEVVDFLVLVAHVTEASEWHDRIEYIP